MIVDVSDHCAWCSHCALSVTRLLFSCLLFVSSLHRSFWTAIASKLQSVCFDELVVGQYFTPRSGALQFLRDMRALILLFAPYQNAHTLSSASAGSGISTHFKLVQDTMNLLLLSSRQRTALLLDLTSGSLASSSPAVVKQHLARPPYQLQRMQGKQVVELLQHVREHTEEEQQQPQQDAEQQEEDESQGQAEVEADEDQDNEAHEPEEDPTDGAAAAGHAEPFSLFEEDEPELEALEDLSPSHADQADDPAADLDLDAAEQREEHEQEAAAESEDEAAADLEQAAVAEEAEEAAVAEEADEQPFEDEDDASAAVEAGHSEAADEDEDEAAEPVDFLAAAAARALASASAAAPTAADAPQDGPEEQEEEPNLDDFGGFPDEPDVDADEANDGVAP